ncbi:MAG: type II toxin-antitoxin system Phd/YefM family antitoxin [Hyphomicrobiales bacterium]|nr:type II toxin-antitoxin system Phd/YefM family antitoxin [Hyphomicrobiales bacterium]
MLTKSRRKKPSLPGSWKLHDAKARFSELVRRAQSDGPQRVTVHGKDTVVVLSAEDYGKAKLATAGARTGEELIQAMQQARKLGLRLRPARAPATARPPFDFSDDGR